MTLPTKPRVIGFDMPSPGPGPGGVAREPIIAILDVEPDAAWVEAFERAFDEVKASLGVMGASVQGRSVFFEGLSGDTRRLSVQLRALVDRVSATRRDKHEPEGPVAWDLGSLLFRRKD